MPKAIADVPMSTRAARTRLPVGLHWRGIDDHSGAHLGYRRGRRGGEWLVRWRAGAGYLRETIGAADDVLTADDVNTFSFDQAARAAKAVLERVHASAIVAAAGPIQTVRTAVEAYLDDREAREREQRPGKALKRDARSRLTRYALKSKLAEKPLHELTKKDLEGWRKGLSGLAETSVRRTVNDFKAALNRIASENYEALPNLTSLIKNALKAKGAAASVARQIQPLNDDEVRAVLKAAADVDAAGGWGGDLHRLVLVLAATGARFSQVAAVRVGDVESAGKRIMVPVSQKGRGEKQRVAVPVQIGDDVLTALRPAMAKRKTLEPLLERWRHRQTGPAKWERTTRGPWTSASEMRRPWALVAAEAGLPANVVPYVLRHSSIVRGLRAGLPVRLVADLHDTSAKMIETHYSRWISDTETELARRAIVPLYREAKP